MPKIRIYQIDAFANHVFEGNPAAICPLSEWLPDETMQKIAAENNLAETAFIAKESDGFRIRWFTPTVEVDLCGHATLASAFVYFNFEGHTSNEISFQSRSGILTIKRLENSLLQMNFPSDIPKEVESPKGLLEALQIMPKADTIPVYKGKTDYLVLLNSEEEVKDLNPDFRALSKINARGVIVTAKGKSVDFISRFFAPQSGIDEDPVTGSAHTTLTPFWAHKLDKTILTARQISARGGELWCEMSGNRVKISGKAIKYLEGEIEIFDY